MYYATYIYCPCAVAIFDNPDDRDRWVHHIDQRSQGWTGVDRTALSYDQAKKVIGDSLDDEKNYYIDDGITWIESETQYPTDEFLEGKSPTVFEVLGVSML